MKNSGYSLVTFCILSLVIYEPVVFSLLTEYLINQPTSEMHKSMTTDSCTCSREMRILSSNVNCFLWTLLLLLWWHLLSGLQHAGIYFIISTVLLYSRIMFMCQEYYVYSLSPNGSVLRKAMAMCNMNIYTHESSIVKEVRKLSPTKDISKYWGCK